MDEDKSCPVHRRPCISRKEQNYFFRLSRYQKEIEVCFTRLRQFCDSFPPVHQCRPPSYGTMHA